jgi:hypothetical protein
MKYALVGIATPAILCLAACSVAPYRFPDTPPRQDLVPIDATRIVVKEEFRYSPTLTSIVLPAGEYAPVKADSAGTYYESPRGLLILPVVGQGIMVRGGIFRLRDATANYQFTVYGWLDPEPLHNMWGLNLNEKIECTPACAFK